MAAQRCCTCPSTRGAFAGRSRWRLAERPRVLAGHGARRNSAPRILVKRGRAPPPTVPAFDIELIRAVVAQTSDVVLVLRPDGTIAASVGVENLGYIEEDAKGACFSYAPGEVDRVGPERDLGCFRVAESSSSIECFALPSAKRDLSRHAYEGEQARL